jgi:hypothetical protein
MGVNAEQAYRDLEIAELSIQPGNTYQMIADQFSLTKGRISQILSKPQIKEVVRQGTNQLITLIPLAIDNYLKILSDPEHTDYYKANRDILQNTGILASHAGGNTYIQQVFNATGQPTDIEVNRFAEIIQARQDTDILDAEYTDEMQSLDDTD